MPSASGAASISAPPRQVHAHSARAAGQAVRSIIAALTGRIASLQHIDVGVFCAAEAADVVSLFSALDTALEAPFAGTRATALRTAILALRGLPPHLAAPHLLPLTRRLVALHRPSVATPDPRFILALASCAAAAAPLRALGKDAEAVCAALVDTSLAHVAAILNAIAPVRHDSPALGSLLCLSLACVTAAPSLVRPRVPMLMALVNEVAFQSAIPSVRSTAVILAARLLGARSAKARPHEVAALMTSACDDIEQIVAVTSRYTARPGSCGEVDAVIHSLDAPALLSRFQALCELLTTVLVQPFPHAVVVPISRAVSALTGALRISGVDPMATSQLQPMLTPEDVLAILPGIHETALLTLPTFLEAVQKGAALPCFPCVAHVVADSLLNHVPALGTNPKLTSLRIRTALYGAVASFTSVFGPPAVDLLAHPFATVFAADIALCDRLRNARRRSCAPPARTDDSGGGFLGSGNARKRRRMHGGRGAAGAASQALLASIGDKAGAPGEDAMRLMDSAVSAGVRASTAIFRACGIPEPAVRGAILSLEKSVAATVAIRENRSSALAALAAAIQGAGSNGVRAYATPLLESALLAVPAMEHAGADPDVSRDAVANAKAALEALLHPRGPPVLEMSAAPIIEPQRSKTVAFAHLSSAHIASSAVGGQSHVGSKYPPSERLQLSLEKQKSNDHDGEDAANPHFPVVSLGEVVSMNTSEQEINQGKKPQAVEKVAGVQRNSAPLSSEVKMTENVAPLSTTVGDITDEPMEEEEEGSGGENSDMAVPEMTSGMAEVPENGNGNLNDPPADAGDDNLEDDEEDVLKSLRFEASDED